MHRAETPGPWASTAHADPRWTRRQTLAFAFGASLLLWSIIGLAIQAVMGR